MNERFLRARKPEEKELRSNHLLATARSLLLQDADIKKLSLNEIARKSGMAKANVYRYFETREALLLELLWSEWQDWFDEFQKKWAKKPNVSRDLMALISLFAETIACKKLLCSLTAALPAVLEANLSAEKVKEFKFNSLRFFAEIASRFENSCPELTAHSFAILLQDTITFIVGIYPFAFPNETVAKVLSHPDLRFFRRDFRGELERYLIAVASSLQKSPSR